MLQSLKAPDNFRVTGIDGAALLEWKKVEGAEGYKLQFFTAENPETCIKSRYAQNCKKTILGLQNGKEYLVQVCAFAYENNKEVRGNYTGKLRFVPISTKLKAQGAICLKTGETGRIVCECNGKKPNVKFVSENPEIAEVNASGEVKALMPGIGYILITGDDGQTFRTKIAVDRSLSRGYGNAVVMLAGDLMCALNHQRAAHKFNYDFNDAFSHIKDILIKSDYAMGVLETTCYDMSPYEHEQLRLEKGSPNCNSPSTFISACANAGFNALVTANNHNCDTGMAGLEATVSEIKKQGMDNIGTLGDNPQIIQVNGIKIGILACCMISNGLDDDLDGNPLSIVNSTGKYDEEYFIELINRAKAMGAEYIIAYQHWGKMNSPKTVPSQRKTAKFMAESGADLIVGSHPHVVQNFSYIKTESGKRVPCAFSLGNFLTTMKEMRENRDSVLLRLELSRENGGIKARISYVPCFCEDIEQGAAVVTAYPPHSDASRESFQRTKAVMGRSVNFYKFRPKVLLSGSSFLYEVISAGKDFRVDKAAMFLSQMSLGSKKICESPKDCGNFLSLEIGKDLAGYIDRACPDYLAVDFYTAATVSCHRIFGDDPDDPCYYTNTKKFRSSEYFAKHSAEMVRVRPPFGENIWKPVIKRYSEIVRDSMPNGRVILFRCRINENKFAGSQVRTSSVPERTNKLIKAMEDLFIGIVDPVVVDLSKHFFSQNNSNCKFEREFYLDAHRAVVEITNQKGRTCISEPSVDLWFDRVMRFYDDMSARSCQNRLLDMNCAADKIIAYTSKDFSQRNRDRLIQLKMAGKSDLTALREFFEGDLSAEEIVQAGEMIYMLEHGNLNKPYEYYAPAFREHYSMLNIMIRRLASETKIPVNHRNVETVFLLRGKPQLKHYEAMIGRKTVDIWGSSVSLESVSRCEDVFVGKRILNQAPVLAFEPPVEIELPESLDAFGGSATLKRTFRETLERTGFDALQNKPSQWIVIDFYDLICDMVEYKDELIEIDDLIRDTDFFKSIKDDCEECYLFEKRDMKYCCEIITRFAEEISKRYKEHVILIKADPKDSYITIDDKLRVFEDDGMFEFKRKFISLCEECFSSITGCYVIDISKHFYSSDKSPLGGAHIVHYEEEFYIRTAKYISEIINGTDRKIFSTADENYLLLRSLKLNRDK